MALFQKFTKIGEYLPTNLSIKSTSHVGKYTSPMDCMGIDQDGKMNRISQLRTKVHGLPL